MLIGTANKTSNKYCMDIASMYHSAARAIEWTQPSGNDSASAGSVSYAVPSASSMMNASMSYLVPQQINVWQSGINNKQSGCFFYFLVLGGDL